MRFIRKNGRVIPIREKSDGSRKQGVETTFKFTKVHTTAKSRFKDGAKMGGVIGSVIGLQFGLRGAAAGGALGALAVGAENALIGRRSYVKAEVSRIRKVSKGARQ